MRLWPAGFLDGRGVVRILARFARYPFAPPFSLHIRDADVVHVHGSTPSFDFGVKVIHRPLVASDAWRASFHTEAHGGLKRIWFSTVTRRAVTQRSSPAAQPDFDMFEKASRPAI